MNSQLLRESHDNIPFFCPQYLLVFVLKLYMGYRKSSITNYYFFLRIPLISDLINNHTQVTETGYFFSAIFKSYLKTC